MNLCILIPCHNDAMTIRHLVNQLVDLLDPYRIILIDDCSTDNTGEVFEDLKRAYPKHISLIRRKAPLAKGYGRAVRAGFRYACDDLTATHLLTIDADMEMRPTDALTMVGKAQAGWDVVIGSRFTKGGQTYGYSRLKLLMNRFFNISLRWLIGTNLKDLTIGFKVMRIEVARDIMWKSNEHGLGCETSIKPILLGYRVTEVPIAWIKNPNKRSSFRIRMYREYAALLLNMVFERALASGRG